jgi:hypothetical protein
VSVGEVVGACSRPWPQIMNGFLCEIAVKEKLQRCEHVRTEYRRVPQTELEGRLGDAVRKPSGCG